ncbi:hypothetical protein MNB_SUP05-SYMBIONT-5-427 [hydrothermal vent metagenome]|uniref:Uncharacterized protein n=1 Tax=hydrothermal vent metagenome TaxID=652676 RepID=A0A1W1E115_9ZZZZ
MALAGLLAFSLHGVGIFGAFIFAMAFTIPPILEKIREASKEQGKEISTNFAVLSAGFFAICGIVFMVNSGEKTIKESLPYPAEQVQLMAIAKKYALAFDDVSNEVQQSQLREQRSKELLNFLYSNTKNIENWIGRISNITTSSTGDAFVSITVSPYLTISTWNNTFSDINYDTKIDKDTAIYATLATVQKGDLVYFTGKFFESDNDSIKEQSLTIMGSMEDPDFLLRFYDIVKINR